MTKIITTSSHKFGSRLNEFYSINREHIFIIELLEQNKKSLFNEIDTQILSFELLPFTSEKGDQLQKFVFYVNKIKKENKRLIIICKDGRKDSGAVALWAMEWLMDNNEDQLYKDNPDILPNENLLKDLYLHPII